jgi:nuclease HARBI1
MSAELLVDMELFLDSEDDDDDDEELFILSYLFNDHSEEVAYPGIDIWSLSDDQALLQFRFTIPELQELCVLLQLPHIWRSLGGHTCPALEGLCIMLRRLASGCRLYDIGVLFGKSVSFVSEITATVLFYIHERYGRTLDLANSVNATSLGQFTQAISNAGAPLTNCWGFLDATVRRCARPKKRQAFFYSGHKHTHGLKFQGIMVPSGLIAHLWGPIPARRHDQYVLHESYLTSQLSQPPFAGLVVYADGGYVCTTGIVAPYTGNMTNSQMDFNKLMSVHRVSVEHGFGRVQALFSMLNVKHVTRIHQCPVAVQYAVAVIFTNIRTCMDGGNLVSEHFGLPPLSLEEYLAL